MRDPVRHPPRSGAAPSRRSLLLIAGVAGTSLVTASGCSDSTRRPRSSPPVGSRSASTPPSASVASFDAELRSRAIGDERRLLAACAGPTALEPFATLRSLHAAHLSALTGQGVAELTDTGQPPLKAKVVGAERSAAAARRSDCLAASSSLAPLLASIAADGDVAVALLES